MIIVPFLRRIPGATFFTRDVGFYNPLLCDRRYGIACLRISQHEIATFVRRFLRHPRFASRTDRMGVVARVSHTGVRIWQAQSATDKTIPWQI
jgi:hypothetical protein